VLSDVDEAKDAPNSRLPLEPFEATGCLAYLRVVLLARTTRSVAFDRWGQTIRRRRRAVDGGGRICARAGSRAARGNSGACSAVGTPGGGALRDRAGATNSLVEQGTGLAYAFEPSVREPLHAGRLKIVLERYAATVPGFFLYYPSVARRSGPLRLFVEAAR
jgi:hypothetical protein